MNILANRRPRLLLARSTAKVASNSLCGLKDLRVIKLNEKCFKIRPFKLLTAAIFLKRPQLTSEVTRDLVRRSRRRQIASFLIFLMEKIIAFLVCTLTTFFHSFFSYVCRSPSDMKEAISSTSNNFNLRSTAVELYQKRMLLG